MRCRYHIGLLLFSLLLSFIHNGTAGVTSDFTRSEWPPVDIPLDNEVFPVPNGYNAPQQVSLSSLVLQVFQLTE